MSSAELKRLPTELRNLINGFLESAIGRLNETGELTTGVGSHSDKSIEISFASATGGKTSNDDFVAFIKPASENRTDWAAAIADGVSGSLLGGIAAELASMVSLAAIIESPSQNTNAGHAVSVANRVLRRIGSMLESDPERFCPNGVPVSIWKRAVEGGKVLQTTLNLIWSVEGEIQVVAVGDGGLLYSDMADQNAFAVQQFGSGKLECIGPKNVPHNVEAYRIADWGRLACFTDGLNEIVEEVKDFSTLLFDRCPNSANDAIRFVNEQHPELVEDNLSVIRLVRRTNE